MTPPFDLDVLDVKPEPTPRERLLRLLPSLTSDQVASLVHAGEEMIRARRLHLERLTEERRATRLVGPEREQFLTGS